MMLNMQELASRHSLSATVHNDISVAHVQLTTNILFFESQMVCTTANEMTNGVDVESRIRTGRNKDKALIVLREIGPSERN
jgi:hypothetical protein